MRAPLLQPGFLQTQVEFLLAGVAVDPVRHQRMRRIKRALDRHMPVSLLAAGNVALGEIQVIENARRIGPQLEQIVVLEEMVVAEGCVGNHQRLHGRRIFLHQVGNAGRTVDDDLVGKAAQALAVECLVMGEMLAERPVLVEQRHSDRRIDIEHLLGGDDLDLVGIDVQAEFVDGDLLAGIVDALQRGEIPVCTFEKTLH